MGDVDTARDRHGVRHEPTPRAASRPGLWQLINQPRRFVSPHSVRLACALLCVGYGAIAIVRHDPQHMELFWVRLPISLYGGLGILLANRFTWSGLRLYTFGLAFLLPLDAGYVTGVLGNRISDLPLLALATFTPLLFLQTGRDFLVGAAGMLLGHGALLFFVLPPPTAPVSTVCLVLVVTVLIGTTLGMTTLVYRAVLQDSLGRLEGALQAKSQFLNTMSHELRSPLHVIIGYADIWREESSETPAQDAAQRVRLAALELLQLVENTLNVARLEAGRITLRLEEFHPSELFRELAAGTRALPEAQAGVPVTWQVSSGLPVVCLDRLKLKEIVQNLVSNALKFTHEGTITVSAALDSDRLEITVRDGGIGIAPEAQSRIFDLFERIEAPDGHRAGVGLGLYIVKNLVELMQGTISVASRSGEGATFTVRLPVRLDDIVADPATAKSRPDAASLGVPRPPLVAVYSPIAGRLGA